MYVHDASFGSWVTRTKVVNGFAEPSLIPLTAAQQGAVGALVSGGRPFCTGCLIASHVVLSAAHCSAVPGTQFVTGADAATPDAVATVVQVVKNAAWVGSKDDHALLLLDRAVAGAKPFAVAAATPPPAGAEIQGVGYGLTSPDAEANTHRWWTVEPVLDLGIGWFSVDGRGVRGLCNGDSGGPAFALVDGEPRIVGTVSQGDISCVGEDLYSTPDPAWVTQVLAQWPAPGTAIVPAWRRAALPAAAAFAVLLGAWMASRIGRR